MGLRPLTLLGLQARIPPGAWMSLTYEFCVLSGRVLCEGLIPRPEESYRVCCVVCDREASKRRKPWSNLLRHKKKNLTERVEGGKIRDLMEASILHI